MTASVQAVLDAVTDPAAYCFWWGVSDAEAIVSVAQRTQLKMIVIDPDRERVEALRKRLADADLYGSRVAAHVGRPWEFGLPPYAAHLIVVEGSRFAEDDASRAFARALFASLRPYGGVALLAGAPEWLDAFARTTQACDLANARLERRGDRLTLTREGALPGSANWAQNYCDAGNTVVSKDRLVKAPLGLLWFGGSSNSAILPRHGHGPPEQIVDGRLFIEGPNSLRAMDVYTGRVLWDRELPGVGKPYDNTSHQPGANALGSNYVSASDGIYVAYEQRCLVLDPATGETLREFTLPPLPGSETPPAFGIMKVWEDLLVVAASPIVFVGEKAIGLGDNWDATCSKRLTALDRRTGEVRWSRDAGLSFRHNAIAVGGERVYCIDKLPDPIVKRIEEGGKTVPAAPKLLCLDVRTGETIWERDEGVFGSWLGYSEERDLLLQAGRPSRDMLSDERGDRMMALEAGTGEVRWDLPHEYYGPCLIHGDRIITQTITVNTLGGAYDLLTGERLGGPSPVTGVERPWTYGRHYGCNTVIGSEHLITFRSAAAGYYDLVSDGGTANLGGYKSSCTSNLIAANGVLNSPDYTRTCTCSYQNQTSLALIHMPDVEMWSFNTEEASTARVQRLGVNLGAPGDRRDDEGVLWLDYPSVGGPSPDVAISRAPEQPRWFRRHSLRVSGSDHRWVAASGAVGLESLDIALGGAEGQRGAYAVTLHFVEPGDAGPGERVFDVLLNGVVACSGLDVAAEAGGPLRALVKEVGPVEAGETLTIDLRARAGETVLCGVKLEAIE